ncbi:glycoside hydrolase family 3 protein [Dentipellis sp. KUC8613]|nr:glycoside hydrolase family 3 protein [Dentipellis sp. KUC8613]
MAPSAAQLRLGAVAALAVFLSSASAGFPDCKNGPLKDNLVCNPHAHYTDRAKAVVDEFTLDELISNSINNSTGVPRLGLPPYNWWSEGLHGVASSPGVTFAPSGDFSSATSFPEPIIMSAAFDDDLIHSIAGIVSTEARAFNNAGRAGLDYWTPNINPFKDPRWGRGQETPGEDPYHIQRYVYQLITGLQGGVGPASFKIIADCKHFAGYDLENWEGNERYGFDAQITTQDLAEYYTPGFQACVRDAKVGSIMCSYNAVNGVPSCANEYFLKDLVRDYYGLGNDQWITSDCDAVGNVFTPHNYTQTLAEASAVSLKAGTDIDCGTSYSESLGAAVNQSLVTQADLQQALYRQFNSLVRLGYFDPPESQPLRQVGWSSVNTKPAQQLAYQAAAEGIVLLKNDGTLPLSGSKKNVAIIGPWANATKQLQGNYEGVAPFLVSPVQGFQNNGFTVQFANGTGIASSDTSGFEAALSIARAADIVIYAGGIDDSYEAEALDRTDIVWPGNQLDLVDQLAGLNKTFVVLQMGGGQVDSSKLKADSRVNALIWGGYPGQSGGQALADIITGKVAPAGRLVSTQYPADYVNEIPMTNMNLRPDSSGSPGRTYKWYTGTPVYEFGFGQHYTTFSLSWASGGPKRSYSIQQLVAAARSKAHLDLGVLDTFKVNVKNTGHTTSDYVALLFSNTTAGPSPAPLKQLVSYDRVKGVAPGRSATASLEVTLGTIARVDENGNSVLAPGTYNLWLDTDHQIPHSFELTGTSAQISNFPQPPH